MLEVIQNLVPCFDYNLSDYPVILLKKYSLVEYLAFKNGLPVAEISEESARELFSIERFYRAWASHLRQQATWSSVVSLFKNPVIIDASDLFTRKGSAMKAFVSPGLKVAVAGDEVIGTVAAALGSDSLLLPVVADEETSDGVLGSSLNDLYQQKGGASIFHPEKWQKIEVLIDGVSVGESVNTVFIGDERSGTDCLLSVKTQDAELPYLLSAGMIFCSGLGSTGWLASASGRPLGECSVFTEAARDPNAYILYVDQPYNGSITKYEYVSDILGAGDIVIIRSELVSGGEVVIDSGVRTSFPRGSELYVRPSAGLLRCSLFRPDEEPFEFVAEKEVLAGHGQKQFMSRYHLEVQKTDGTVISEEQKSSGIRIGTQLGAASWPEQSCSLEKPDFHHGTQFSPDLDRIAMAVLGAKSGLQGHHPVMTVDGESIEIEVVPVSAGVSVVVDAYTPHVLKVGQKVTMRLSADPVNVVFPVEKRQKLSTKGL